MFKVEIKEKGGSSSPQTCAERSRSARGGGPDLFVGVGGVESQSLHSWRQQKFAKTTNRFPPQPVLSAAEVRERHKR